MFKPLNFAYNEEDCYWEAETPFGDYFIEQSEPLIWELYGFFMPKIELYDSFEAAKVAAQEDYSSRLSEALDKYGQRAKSIAAAQEFADGGTTDDY